MKQFPGHLCCSAKEGVILWVVVLFFLLLSSVDSLGLSFGFLAFADPGGLQDWTGLPALGSAPLALGCFGLQHQTIAPVGTLSSISPAAVSVQQHLL